MRRVGYSHYIQRLSYLYDLLRELVVRDMKLRYKRSVLGFGWSLLNPLLQLLVFSFVFRLVLPLNIPNYSSFLFVGIIIWSWFQSSLLLATASIVDNRELIRQPHFPAAMLPIVSVTTHLVHFLLALPVLFLFLIVSGSPLTITVIILPLVVGLQFTLTVGLAYLLATFHVTFRDIQYLLNVALLLMFYLTPIFYDDRVIPDRLRFWYNLNPMTTLLHAYRAILLEGKAPDTYTLLVLGAFVSGLVWLGHAVFAKASSHFVEEL